MAGRQQRAGFPLRAGYPGAKTMTFSADAGALFTWGTPDIIADNKGLTHTVAPDDRYTGRHTARRPHGTPVYASLTAFCRRAEADVARSLIRQTGAAGYSVTQLANE